MSFFITDCNTKTRRVSRAVLCSFFAVSLLAGCSSSSSFEFLNESTENPETIADFDSFLDQIFRSEIVLNTINLHYTLADPEGYGITDYDISLGDISDDAIDDANARYENYFSTLQEFDYSSLSENQKLTYDILYDYMKTQLDVADLYLYDELLRPSTGVQANLPILFEEYTFYNEQDIKNYLQLISLTSGYFEQVIAFEQEKAKAGLFMSDFACENVISQCNDFTADPEHHYLIETFNNRLDSFSNLSQEQRESYKIENENLVKNVVIPSFEKLSAALSELLGSGTNDMGLCYFPEGKDYYEYLVYMNTGCSESVKDIEKMVSDERMKVLQEAADLMSEDSELWERCNEITLNNSDPTTTLNKLQQAMQDDFPTPPATSFTVNYIDECVADYLAPAFYVTAPIDHYTSNSIYINEETDTSAVSYFTTLAHEGFPGHLYQTVMTYEAGILPVRSLFSYSGYSEGWATYVEMKSYSYLGVAEEESDLLQLNQSALLSLYASTDLGIHYDGWTFDDTLEFWDNYGISDDDTIKSIYELIIEEPSHYLKYYVGYLQFLDLKESAMLKYLHHYSDTAFHQAVLEIGPAPFAIIEKYLDDYYVYDGE